LVPPCFGETTVLIADSELVSRAQRGDDEAFSELVDRYRERLFFVALSVLGPAFSPEAEDAAQVGIMKAYRAIAGFRAESSVATWLSRIVRHEALAIKARSRFRRPHLGEESVAAMPHQAATPEQESLAKQQNADLQACIQHLPEIYQTIVRLYYWLDWPVGEIAALLVLPENTVKSYLHRARKLLHNCLSQRGYDES